MTPAMLRQLLRIAEARKVGDLARLDALMVASRACEAEISEAALTAARDTLAGIETPMAQRALRLAWADQRIAAARRRLAALGLEVAAARAAAIRSLGKHQALEKLVEKAERDAALVRAARNEREAPPPEAPPG